MKRNLFWISLLGLGLLALSCAPAAAPAKTPLDGQTRAGASAAAPAPVPPLREGRPEVAPYSPSGAAPAQGEFAAARPADAVSPEAPGGAAGDKGVFDRMIIYAAQTSMEVKDVTQSMEDIASIANEQGGFVVSSNFRFEGERKVAAITIKVPARVYQSTLAALRRLAIRVEDENTKSQDVTEEFSDLDAQLRNLRATEDRYLELLRRANSIDEILKVQARIDETRRQIDRIKGRMDYLDKTSEMASITISLFSKDKGKLISQPETNGWWKTPGEAWEQSLLFLGRVVSFIAIGVAFFWWAIILVGTAALFIWRSLSKAARTT